MDAFQFGAPPELAFGLDRLVAILGGKKPLFYAFPK
jgi:aspartyl-tRNA synthetase